MTPIRFNPNQRAELLRLGLVPECVDQIEQEGLPQAKLFLEREPPRADVRAELQGLRDALGEAREAIERLLEAKDTVPHLYAARRKIYGGGQRHMMGGLRLDETSKSLQTAVGVVSEALDRLPPEPVRHQSADPFPIERIHSAVQLGLIRALREPQDPHLRPSNSPTSAFRRIVGVCYEAIGAPTSDPERAIKAYVKEWRALAAHIERLRAAQNPLGNSDVLS